MKKYFHIFALALFVTSAAFLISCDENTNKQDHSADVEADNPAFEPTVEDSSMNMDTGSTGGMNNLDPEGNGGKMDAHQDEMNAGTNNQDNTTSTGKKTE